MENIINKIIQIEDQAQKIMRDADNLKCCLNENIDKQVTVIRTDIENRIRNKFETIKKTESAFADQKIQEIETLYKHTAEELQETYQAHRDEWVDTIYKTVLGI